MEIRPLRNKVALKEFVTESTTTSGIFLMGGDPATPEFGVVAIGSEVESVQVGDRVMIEMGKGHISGDTLIIEEQYIIGVLND